MVYDEMGIEEIVVYINGELLKGRPMKEIERVDFGVNERVITKRLARKNIKKVDGQFVLQDGSKMSEVKKNKAIEPVSENRDTSLVENKKLTIFPIGIGSGANMQRLQQFSPKREPLKLKGLMLSEFFDWLGKSVKTTSQSAPGTSVKLPPIGWAEL